MLDPDALRKAHLCDLHDVGEVGDHCETGLSS
jgi:hypothetical protein